MGSVWLVLPKHVNKGRYTHCRVASMKQRVTAVAAANRHTVVVAEGGTVYSWGSNLQGQLGYGTSDSASNAVPRIVEAMKVGLQTHVGDVSESVLCLVLHAAGQSDGNLTSVGVMQGKNIVAVAAAKRHTVALSSEGDVYTWGHRVVTPRRVQLAGEGTCAAARYAHLHAHQSSTLSKG